MDLREPGIKKGIAGGGEVRQRWADLIQFCGGWIALWNGFHYAPLTHLKPTQLLSALVSFIKVPFYGVPIASGHLCVITSCIEHSRASQPSIIYNREINVLYHVLVRTERPEIG